MEFLFAYFILKEKPTIRSLIGIFVAFIGVYILTGSPNLDGKYLGIFLTILGSGIWAFGQVLVKPLSKELNPLTLVAWLAFFSGPILILLSNLFDGNSLNYIKSASTMFMDNRNLFRFFYAANYIWMFLVTF